MSTWAKDNGFNGLTHREQMNKRIATLNEISREYGQAAADGIKYTYDWRNMTPAWMVKAAQSRQW